MKVALFHGYELTGSGSNEFTRYLSRALARQGHEVHVYCREPKPERVKHITDAFSYDTDGEVTSLFEGRDVDDIPGNTGKCIVHQLPHVSVRPVYLCDKQRVGNVKPFTALTEEELGEYHATAVKCIVAGLTAHPVQVLMANHMVYQPMIAREACAATKTKWIIYPHGSSIEYTLREDKRYLDMARDCIKDCDGMIIGNHEVRDRVIVLYPDLKEVILGKCRIVGVGVDTTLFSPVARSERAAQSPKLARHGPFLGRENSLRDTLHQNLSTGSLDILPTLKTQYNQALPDADINAKLDDLDWTGSPVLLFVGALTAGKGLQSLITALPSVLARHPTATLLIVGSGSYRETLEALVFAISTGDEALLTKLVTQGWDLEKAGKTGAWLDVEQYLSDAANKQTVLSAGAGFSDRIRFLGRLNHDLLCYVAPCADFAVFPSVVPEAYPLVLMESLSNGVFPVVTDFSGFTDGLNELATHIGDDLVDKLRLPRADDVRIQGISDKLSHLLDIRTEIEGTRKHLREIAVQYYDWAIRGKALVKAFEELTP